MFLNRLPSFHQHGRAALLRLPVLTVVPASAFMVHELTTLPSLSWLMLLALICLLLYWVVPRRTPMCLILASLTVLGTVASAQSGLQRQLTDEMQGVDYTVTGRVVSMVTRFKHGRRFLFVIDQCVLANGPCPRGRRVRLSWYGNANQPMTSGQRWRLNVRLKRIHGTVNPGGFDTELRALQTGLDGAGYVRSKRKRDTDDSWRGSKLLGYEWTVLAMISAARDATQRAMKQALTAFTAPTSGTLVALVTGNQSAIPAQTWEVYNRTGTSHLMSISGLHVTMFAAMAIELSRRLLRCRFVPPGTLNQISAPYLAWACGLIAALAYSAFSGWGIPAQRTTLMLAVAGLVMISGRGAGAALILAWVAAVVTLFDPWAVRSTGFWLSFGAVAAIIAVSQGWIGAGKSKWLDAVRTQLAATIVLVPLGAVWFGSVSVISPLANALAIPLVAGFLTPVAMAGALLSVLVPAVGAPVLWLTAWLTAGLLWTLSQLSAIEDAIWITGTPTAITLFLACVGVIVLLRPAVRLPAQCGVALITPLLFAPTKILPKADWSLLAVDVGQGSAIIIQTARHALLFDTGPVYDGDSGAGNRLVAPLLRTRRIRELDAIVVSHRDSDHIGGADILLQRFGSPTLLTSIEPTHRLRSVASRVENCDRSMHWEWDGVRFEFLHPGSETVQPGRSKTNARSCVLRIDSPAGSALLTGDIEKAQETQLMSIYSADHLRADVLIAPHHGSATSSSEPFLDTVAPQWAVFQVGYRNRYRHPAARVLKRYLARDIGVLRTDEHGAVEFRFIAGKRPQLLKYRQLNPPYWRG